MANIIADRALKAFTKRFQSRIPAELRNQVFDELLDDQTLSTIAEFAEEGLQDELGIHLDRHQGTFQPIAYSYLRFVAEHFVDSSFLSELLSYALSKAYITVSINGPSHINGPSQIAHLTRLPSLDPLRIGFPVSQFRVSELRVHFTLYDYDRNMLHINTLPQLVLPLQTVPWKMGAALTLCIRCIFPKARRHWKTPSPKRMSRFIFPAMPTFRTIAHSFGQLGVNFKLELDLKGLEDLEAGDYLHQTRKQWEQRWRELKRASA